MAWEILCHIGLRERVSGRCCAEPADGGALTSIEGWDGYQVFAHLDGDADWVWIGMTEPGDDFKFSAANPAFLDRIESATGERPPAGVPPD